MADKRMKEFRELGITLPGRDVRDHIGIALSAIRRLPDWMIHNLDDREHWQDVRQAVLLAACESQALGDNLKDSYNRAQNAIYHCLRELGYMKPRGAGFYCRPTIQWSALSPQTIRQIEIREDNCDRVAQAILPVAEKILGPERWAEVWQWASTGGPMPVHVQKSLAQFQFSQTEGGMSCSCN